MIERKYDEYSEQYDQVLAETLAEHRSDYDTKKAEYDAQRDPIIERYLTRLDQRAEYCASQSEYMPIGKKFTVPYAGSDIAMTITTEFSI